VTLPEPEFVVVLRGYHRGDVDTLVSTVHEALNGGRGTITAAELRGITFRVTLRGYDRGQVDEWLKQAASELP